MLRGGMGVDEDPGEAVRWLRFAADAGNAQAQAGLAACYAEGRGVERDFGEAARLYGLARDQGYPGAAKALAKLGSGGSGRRTPPPAAPSSPDPVSPTTWTSGPATPVDAFRKRAPSPPKPQPDPGPADAAVEAGNAAVAARRRIFARDSGAPAGERKPPQRVVRTALSAPSPPVTVTPAPPPSAKPDPDPVPPTLTPAAGDRAHRRVLAAHSARPAQPPAPRARSESPDPELRQLALASEALRLREEELGRLARDVARVQAGSEPSPPPSPEQLGRGVAAQKGRPGPPGEAAKPARMAVSHERSGLWVEEHDVAIDRTQRLGRGGFSEVFRGTMRGREVAVKVLREEGDAEALNNRATIGARTFFQAEVRVSAEVPEHENVVALLGYHTSPSFIVTPYFPAGTLSAYLSRLGWPLPAALPLLRDVARGMRHLHAHSVVHHDLKADNVLVDAERDPPVAKISDFGLAKLRAPTGTDPSSAGEAYRGPAGATFRFAPPEYFEGGAMGRPADAWMFGMLCWQVCSGGQQPFAHCAYDRVLMRALNRGERPPRPEGVPDGLWELVGRCWAAAPGDRPGFDEIVGVVEGML
ncbi:kinase-like domain-containing protein [Hyaloraphidium curvatum]|nr:kinase-like domain-containing protein [Hyaloraphidium curvatum]